MTKDELLRKLDALIEHEDCADYKLAVDVAIEVIQADLSDITDWDVRRAYNFIKEYYPNE